MYFTYYSSQIIWLQELTNFALFTGRKFNCSASKNSYFFINFLTNSLMFSISIPIHNFQKSILSFVDVICHNQSNYNFKLFLEQSYVEACFYFVKFDND